jgi:hypothetical protein
MTQVSGLSTLAFTHSGSGVNSNVQLPSSAVLEWSTDTGISRLAAGSLAIGNGTAGGTTGSLQLAELILPDGSTTTPPLQFNNAGANAIGIYCVSNTAMYLQVNGNPRGVVLASGMGVGTTVFGFSSAITSAFDTGISRLGAASLAIGNGTAGDFSGTLKCATVNATSAYQANGTPGVTQTAIAVGTLATIEGIVTTFTGVSDERLKNHAPYTGGLEEILGITPIRFTYNELGQKFGGWDKEHVYVGFSAQNVQKSIPEAIQGTEGKEKYLSFDDRPVIAALCNAIKELTARITELEMSVRYLLEHCRRSVPGNRAQ